jgi:hypothetical protein
MSAIRVRSGAASASPPTGLIPGARESKLSRYFLWWLPVAPFVGFTLAETVFDLGGEGDWELWKAALLGALLMAPFAVGAYFGLRSVLKGFRGGWVGLAANLVLAVLAIGMPIAESLTG